MLLQSEKSSSFLIPECGTIMLSLKHLFMLVQNCLTCQHLHFWTMAQVIVCNLDHKTSLEFRHITYSEFRTNFFERIKHFNLPFQMEFLHSVFNYFSSLSINLSENPTQIP